MGIIITIEGARDFGKSTLARKITAYNRTMTIAEHQLSDVFLDVNVKGRYGIYSN